MFIKLQPDQVPLFWEMIRHCVIQAYKIPKKFQQDFGIKYLENILSGLYQVWIGYKLDKEDKKRINFIFTTKIIDEKYYGNRVLNIDSLYGFRMVSIASMDEVYKNFEIYAKANNCNGIIADYSSKRVKQLLDSHGFETYKSSCRRMFD